MKNLVAALALALSIAGPANASLIGQTANCAITPTPLWTCNTASATVVDPGTEFQLNLNVTPFFSVDLRDRPFSSPRLPDLA
jgi:hypothetical protein